MGSEGQEDIEMAILTALLKGNFWRYVHNDVGAIAAQHELHTISSLCLPSVPPFLLL